MKTITPAQQAELIEILKKRFDQNMHRHASIEWPAVEDRLSAQPNKMWSLFEMERTGGEPDVIGYEVSTDSYLFVDCAAESPEGRRSICYDEAALQARKEYAPAGSATGLAERMGVELLTEIDYRMLQQLGEFDTKTSSWIDTPAMIRELGGAIFGDRRYGQVFVYHNGAQSYYAARGFRAKLQI